MRLIAIVVLFGAAAARGQQPQEWTTGTITYDGAGNITAMGADTFLYDTAGRLVKGTADQQRSGGSNRQEYSYDANGNRLSMTRVGADCVGTCPSVTVTVSASTNRITDHAATYDAAGNMTALDGGTYTYDGAGMLARQTNSTQTIDWQNIYTAGDERIATYTGGGNWQFTVRDLDGKVLRELTASQVSGSTTWTWGKDHVYRDGLLRATVTPSGQQQLHLDHLGTPRLVTNASGVQTGLHSYYPFGDELNLTPTESPVGQLKFTGHQRDSNTSGNSLDYMHARYYSPTMGRFLSIDPVLRVNKSIAQPQLWNRYTYVTNNPLRFIDPTGKYECRGWSSECQAFNTGLLILRAAAFEAARAGSAGATRLRDIMNFYGRLDQPNGVKVEFGTVKGGLPMATTTNTHTGIATVTVDRTAFAAFSSNYFQIAVAATHEGDHGLTQRAYPSLTTSHSLQELMWGERSAYRSMGYINSALRVDDEYYKLWTKEHGFDPGQIEWWAIQSASATCQYALGGCTP